MSKHNEQSHRKSDGDESQSAQKRLIESALELRAIHHDGKADEAFLKRVNEAISSEQNRSASSGRRLLLSPKLISLACIFLLVVPATYLFFRPATKEFSVEHVSNRSTLPGSLPDAEEPLSLDEPAPPTASPAPTSTAPSEPDKKQISKVASANNTPGTKRGISKRDGKRKSGVNVIAGDQEEGRTASEARGFDEAGIDAEEYSKEYLLAEAETMPQEFPSPGANSNDVFFGGVPFGRRVVATRQYDRLIDNPWTDPLAEPLSTFSIDVDTASFTHVRKLINDGHGMTNIHRDAVRIEEWINYYRWKYPEPDGHTPFAAAVETAQCPWAPRHRLVKIGLQGRHVGREQRPPSNLVFLVDVSGSMSAPNKLGLVKKSLAILTEEMRDHDRIAIVVYAGSEGLALPSTPGSEQEKIQGAVTELSSGGSTNGGAGIRLAYQVAEEHIIDGGINRVILCTDGDFNVGITGQDELVRMIEEKSAKNIFLSVAGFGTDNLNDSMLEAISNRGNGNYFFIDSLNEARRVFLSDLSSTLVTIAKDVKIQVEFNPVRVANYRLIGYSNRILEAEDFENDAIDAGEIGAGHCVTALYEVIPPGVARELRYQKSKKPAPAELVDSEELGWLKLRYKDPNGSVSKLIEQPMMPSDRSWQEASDDFRFASAVALLGMKLRGHPSAKGHALAAIGELAKSGLGLDPLGQRGELCELIKKLASQDNGAKPGEIIRYEGGINF